MIRYQSRYVLTSSNRIVEDGALLVRDERIVASGHRLEVEKEGTADCVVDFGEAIVLPPLVNAHTHLELTDFPQWAQQAGEAEAPGSFVDWVLQLIRIKRQVAPEVFAPSVQNGLQQSFASGIGAVGDILSIYSVLSTIAQSPMMGRVFLEVLGRDEVRIAQLLEQIDALCTQVSGTVETGVSPHSPYTLSSSCLEQVLCWAQDRKRPSSMHLAESLAETQFFASSRGELAERLYPAIGWGEEVPVPAGQSPTAYLNAQGGLQPWNLLVHGVQVGKSDAFLLARKGATVVLCPRSNARLGVGIAPVSLYKKHGVSLALGTDSLASCDTLSIWDEMAFARNWFEGQLSPRELLEMATRGGAFALGLERRMGELSAGFGAHFQVLRPSNLPSQDEMHDFLTTPGRTAEVESLYLNGRNVLQSVP